MAAIINRLAWRRAWLRGVRQFRWTCTWADPARTDADPYTELDEAYDYGREFAHRITGRRWDQ